jgi:hypothetical protein
VTDTALIDGLLPVKMQRPEAAVLDEVLELPDEVLLLDEPLAVKVMLVMV